ncbi:MULTISPECIES: zinc-binding dehydrogenase [Metallosphaera]|uniref:Alcohol dehydrogenase n=1 Tax=Metallosphaera cuprina (strain Ar-4) TaxID=1006006 RepID=F4G022_METCR|nr:alcohol dehydrogenase catalytic domain-containing protein [Metallosphaera cuprina]AEB95784.1 alcohol dehydrogenase [Metallosphaera cuprina Ar-4]
MTKAAVLRKFGEPFTIEDIDVGEGNPVEVKASGICGRDLVVWKGGFKNLVPPLILGHEIFGESQGNSVGVFGMETCGECKYCREGKDNLCVKGKLLGEWRPGGYSKVVISSDLFRLPDSQYEKYAAAVCPVATAIHSAKVGKIRKGDTVLVTGAGGGVGIHTIQYLKHIGAKVISLTSPTKRETVSKFSDQVVYKISEIRDVDAVIELVGKDTINDSLKALRREGSLILVGNVSGSEISLIRPALTIMREQRIIGSASYTRSEVMEAVKLIHEGVIKPFFKSYPLNEVNRAYSDIIQGKVIGRAVLLS